jgi:hypothetical protein
MNSRMRWGMIVVLLFTATEACWSQELALYGEITKKYRGKDLPAAGFKIVLVRAGKESAPAYASRTGRYGIYSLRGPLGQFTVRVYNGNDFVWSHEVNIIKKPTRFDIKIP